MPGSPASVRPGIMRRALLVPLILLGAACAAPPPVPPPAPLVAEPGNVTARLTLLDPTPRLGDPIRVRLELANGTSETIARYHVVPWSVRVTGPRGEPVPLITGAGGIAVAVIHPTLRAGVTEVLLGGVDLSKNYLITRPGTYRAFVPVTVSRDFFRTEGENHIASVEIPVGPGTAPPVMKIAERLHRILPPRWQVNAWAHSRVPPPERPGIVVLWTTDNEWDGWAVRLFRVDGSLKSDVTNLSLRITDDPVQKGERRIGRSPSGWVYARTDGRAERAWPGCWERIVRALGIRK